MRRRRMLALGAAAVGFTGYRWETRGARDESAETDPTSTGAENAGSAASTTHIGGSLNGRPRRLGDDLGLIERSDTTWLHAFLDVRKKYERNADPRNDPDVRALRRAGRETDARFVVALKWNFTGNFGEVEPTNVPPSGSPRRNALFEYATKLLAAIGKPVDVLVLGNEPIWEAPDEDVKGRDAPLVSFTRELKEHLVRNYTAGDPRLLVGAFNRLYGDHVRKEYGRFHRQLFRMARNDDDVDGIDLHVHYDGFRQAEEMLAVAREKVPEGTITVTEFSPVWRYHRNKDRSVTAFEGGERFADRYGVPPETTVAEYFQAAKEEPRPRREMAEFMNTMPWYNANFVEDAYGLLNEHDVDIGTFGFLQDAGVRHTDWTADWIPFQINFLFQPGVIDSEDGAHPHYLRDYRNRT